MKTKRPDDLPYPTVWRRFTRKQADGSAAKFKIQDCPDDMFDDLLTFMCEYFMRDETLNKSFEIEKDELAIKEFCAMQSTPFPERLAIVCFEDNDDQLEDNKNYEKPKIIGFSLMGVHSKGDENNFKPASRAISNLFKVFHKIETLNDLFDLYNVNEYMSDFGLSVHPDFRGLGISKELLNTRFDIAKHLGLKIVEATFTSNISQGSAEKCGFTTVVAVSFKELEKITGVKFDTHSQYVKLMARVL